MNRTTAFAAAMATGLLALCAAAAPSHDGASIVDSGSTNTAGYTVNVWSDGTADVTYQNRTGAAAEKSFTISSSLASRFFADLKAARKSTAPAAHCMKSASFGTSTHVHWHGWISPDLDCPPDDTLTTALVNDVGSIRSAGNISGAPLRAFPGGPPRVIVSPLP